MCRRRERHAKTIDIAQEEVLTCLGIHLYERLHRIWQKLRAEEQTWQILFYLCIDALRKSFEVWRSLLVSKLLRPALVALTWQCVCEMLQFIFSYTVCWLNITLDKTCGATLGVSYGLLPLRNNSIDELVQSHASVSVVLKMVRYPDYI